VEIIVIIGYPPNNLDITGMAYRNLDRTLAITRILYYDNLIFSADSMYRTFLEKNISLSQLFDTNIK
jgi:hypothetical protein